MNGVVTFKDGECTGATPGRLLRLNRLGEQEAGTEQPLNRWQLNIGSGAKSILDLELGMGMEGAGVPALSEGGVA